MSRETTLELVAQYRREAERTELRLWEMTLALIRIAQVDESYVMTAAELELRPIEKRQA